MRTLYCRPWHFHRGNEILQTPKRKVKQKWDILTAVVFRAICENYAAKKGSRARSIVCALAIAVCWKKQRRTFTVPQAHWQLAQPTHWVTFTVQACWHYYSHRPAGPLTTGTAYALGNVHGPGLLTFLLSSSRRPVDNWHSLRTG